MATPRHLYEIAACTYTRDRRFVDDEAFRSVVDAVYRVTRDLVADEVARAIESATGTGAYIGRATAARIAREHSKES